MRALRIQSDVLVAVKSFVSFKFNCNLEMILLTLFQIISSNPSNDETFVLEIISGINTSGPNKVGERDIIFKLHQSDIMVFLWRFIIWMWNCFLQDQNYLANKWIELVTKNSRQHKHQPVLFRLNHLLKSERKKNSLNIELHKKFMFVYHFAQSDNDRNAKFFATMCRCQNKFWWDKRSTTIETYVIVFTAIIAKHGEVRKFSNITFISVYDSVIQICRSITKRFAHGVKIFRKYSWTWRRCSSRWRTTNHRNMSVNETARYLILVRHCFEPSTLWRYNSSSLLTIADHPTTIALLTSRIYQFHRTYCDQNGQE